MSKTKLIYLAQPYTFNPNKSFEIAKKVAAKLISQGVVVFSPITHSHPIADELDEKLRTDNVFWLNQDLPILERCDEMIVIVIGRDGHELIKNSSGCQKEISKARQKKLNISYYKYDE